MTLVMRLLPPLKQLSQAPTTAQQALAAAERLFEVLDRADRSADATAARAPSSTLERAIEFDDVALRVRRRARARATSASRRRRGTVVALVGAERSGEEHARRSHSALLRADGGIDSFDGVDTREITLASLRALTGIVSQDTVLFNDTVRNNIAYGAAGQVSRRSRSSARRARRTRTTSSPRFRNGYDTILGERGTRLSGGQRQRLAIARALLVDPPILILDEATSALDTESERLVQEAVDRLLAGRTVFVIAHRLSTVVHADLILVLDHGRIVERGTHAELLAARGAYFRLHSLQFRDERASPPDRVA